MEKDLPPYSLFVLILLMGCQANVDEQPVIYVASGDENIVIAPGVRIQVLLAGISEQPLQIGDEWIFRQSGVRCISDTSGTIREAFVHRGDGQGSGARRISIGKGDISIGSTVDELFKALGDPLQRFRREPETDRQRFLHNRFYGSVTNLDEGAKKAFQTIHYPFLGYTFYLENNAVVGFRMRPPVEK